MTLDPPASHTSRPGPFPPAAPRPRPARLSIVGDVSVDLVLGTLDGWPRVGTERLLPRSELRAGGSAANSALAARHLGLPAHLIGAIGDDDLAQWLRLQLAGIQVDLQTCASDTTVSVGLMHADGERTFFTSHGHLQHLGPDFVLERLPPASPGSIALFTAPFLLPRLRAGFAGLLAEAAARGHEIALDTGWPPEGWTAQVQREVEGWLAHCDHLLVNELEATSLAGGAHARLQPEDAAQRVGARLKPGAHLVIKLGADGALGWVRGRSQRCAAEAVAGVFDTVGAGDGFNTGYLAARCNGAGLGEALAAGCRTAAAILPRFPRKRIAAGELSHCLQPQP